MHFETTFYGLEQWYVHTYKHLGWMLLAKHDKVDYKLTAYLKSFDELKRALVEKQKTTQDEDRREDLRIMLEKVRATEPTIKKLLAAKSK